jgi:hypothetical protein
MSLFAIDMGVAFLLIATYDRPFTGSSAIRPDILLQVIPDAAGADAAESRKN